MLVPEELIYVYSILYVAAMYARAELFCVFPFPRFCTTGCHHPEDNIAGVADWRDLGSTTSKQNTHEAEMILKIVRYLAQQGYGTQDIVIFFLESRLLSFRGVPHVDIIVILTRLCSPPWTNVLDTSRAWPSVRRDVKGRTTKFTTP